MKITLLHDMVVTRNDISEISNLNNQLDKEFDIKDLGKQ